jgi:hypothetical protein
VLQTGFARGQKNREDAIALGYMQTYGAAAADGFIIRVWRDDKNVHAVYAGKSIQTVIK